MGFKAHSFHFFVLFLCISTAAYSKPLPVDSTSKDGTCTHNTGKEGVVHKIEARDVDGDYTDPEYLLTLAEYTNQHDTDSLTDVDAEDYADESLDNDDVSNSGDIIDLDGARADFSEESSGDEHEDDDYHDGFGDDDIVDPDTEHEVPEETSDYDDYDDTFWGNDIVDDDEFRDTLSKEALDDDDDATLEVDDDDDDDIDLPDEAPDSYDDAKVVSPDGYGDAETFGIVDVDDDVGDDVGDDVDDDVGDDVGDDVDDDVGDDVDDDVGDDVDDDVGDDVDDDYETNNESPDEDLNDDDDTHADEVKGPMQVLEEPPSLKHIHKIDHKSKVSRPRNPLNKNNDSKLGRLLKKHHNKDATRKNSVKKYLDDDINDDDGFGDFKLSHKRKEKIPRHKGRRALSASQNVDFSHVQKREVFGSQDQGNGGDSVDRNVDDYDRQFLASRGDFFFENKQPSASDIEKQNVGSTSDTSVDKENDQHVEEDEIEGEEEEEKQMNDMNSSYSNDDNDVSEPGLTSDSVFEEDKVEGEDEEEDNEIKEDNSSHKDDINFDESEVGNPRDDLLTDDDEQNDVASGIDAH